MSASAIDQRDENAFSRLVELMRLDSRNVIQLQRAYLSETVRGALWQAGDDGISAADLLRVQSGAVGRLSFAGVTSSDDELNLGKRRGLLSILAACGEIVMTTDRYYAAPVRSLPLGLKSLVLGTIPTWFLGKAGDEVGYEGILRTLATRSEFNQSAPYVPLRRWLRISDYKTWWSRWSMEIQTRMANVADSGVEGFEIRSFAAGARAWESIPPLRKVPTDFHLLRSREVLTTGRTKSAYFLLQKGESNTGSRIANINNDEKRMLEIALARLSGSALKLRVKAAANRYEFKTFQLPRLFEQQMLALSEPKVSEDGGPTISIFSADVFDAILPALEDIGLEVVYQ
jgi:hypothetical protein